MAFLKDDQGKLVNKADLLDQLWNFQMSSEQKHVIPNGGIKIWQTRGVNDNPRGYTTEFLVSRKSSDNRSVVLDLLTSNYGMDESKAGSLEEGYKFFDLFDEYVKLSPNSYELRDTILVRSMSSNFTYCFTKISQNSDQIGALLSNINSGNISEDQYSAQSCAQIALPGLPAGVSERDVFVERGNYLQRPR